MKNTVVTAGRRPANRFVLFEFFFFPFLFKKEPLRLKEIFSKIFVRSPILYSKIAFYLLFQALKDLHQSRECLILSRHTSTFASGKANNKIAEIKRLIFNH